MTKDRDGLRSLGEAHLFVAVAKADGVVSDEERVRAPHHAQKSQDVLDVMAVNAGVRKVIKADVTRILQDPTFESWTAEQHLEAAIESLVQAKAAGDWGVDLTADRCEGALQDLAILDGYTIKESRFLREIRRRLESALADE